jgi:drug/metabolite transporter (DMT)-like permease
LSYIDPLSSLFISVLVIGENMTLQQLAGAVLLLGSIWIGESSREKGKINSQLN